MSGMKRSHCRDKANRGCDRIRRNGLFLQQI
jgi:hypothetical protein